MIKMTSGQRPQTSHRSKLRQDKRKNLSGGSAGEGGFDFQAEASALVEAKMLAKQSLNWVDAPGDRIPEVIAAETGTGGDDLRVTLTDGYVVDVQSKKGLQRGTSLWQSLVDLAKAVERDSNVYGVLLTDSSASGTIRNQLRKAIERIGENRTDDLPEIAIAFLKQLRVAGIDNANVCCKRLRIIVRDLDSGSSGEEETFAALRTVVANYANVVAARNTLISESHDLIHRRGRVVVADLARKLSQSGIELPRTAVNPLVVRQAFLEWSTRSNAMFLIPALGIALPIDSAWVALRAMEPSLAGPRIKPLAKQIQEYQEWHRLAQTVPSATILDIETAISTDQLIVIVGGPGAGKSTLARRLTWTLSNDGRVVLRISLRDIGIRLRKGQSFEEALLSATTTQGFSRSALATLLNESHVTLVADGLDETDPERAIIAAHLRDWASVHATRRVVVTTRPVGHDPAWFDGWRHFELLPLAENDVEKFAHEIYKLLFPADTFHAKQRAEAFLQDIRKSRTASIAARNPQLLGLLIALHASGPDIGGKRNELFEQVIEVIRQQTTRDRSYANELSASTSRRALEIIGWQLLINPSIDRKSVV